MSIYKFHFTFAIADFDGQHEEHRLASYPSGLDETSALTGAAKHLIQFAARLVGCKPAEFAVNRIMLKSAWRCSGKRLRVSPKELLEAMIRADFAPHGRGEQYSEKIQKPFKPFGRTHRMNRRHR